jgi:nitrogen-specific signal transduction histidine kinase
METFNIRYRSIDKLRDFLETKAIDKEKSILVQIFTTMSSSTHILTLSSAIKNLLPFATIVGVTTDGEIIDGKVLEKNSVISITIFKKSKLRMCFLSEVDENSIQEDSIQISKSLLKKDTKALILFSTYQNIHAQTLLNSLYHDREEQGELVISGALAGDSGRFKKSYVFDSNNISSKGVVAISISGKELYASNHYIHDWEPISRKFRVDKVEDNRVILVDKKPIKELYSHYIGADKDTSLPFYALQFPFVALRNGHYISKLPITDPEDGSLIFTSNIKKGEILQIAFANIDKVDANSKKIFEELANVPAETLFIYASSARRRFLDQFCHREVESLKNIAPMSGFFGYSEFFANAKQCNLLSQSMTVLALSESKEVVKKTYVTKKNSIQNNLDYKTIKVLSNIAQTSSSELQELNKKLEARVREEVRDNRKKDSIMIHNSKLAQLGEMMGLIAHQWRQPLSAISATATGMQIKFELDSWSMEYVESSLKHIEEYVQHLSDTINDFTDFFKPTKKREAILARDIIKKALFIMSPLLTKDSVLVVKKYSSDNLIETYPNEVVQVVLNLLKNADNALVKRKISNPEIYINEYVQKGKNIIEISDNAGGIDEQIIDKIFEPYFSTKNAENSMGLGLYMSRFIIEESCGGSLEVENIDNGVKFTIRL